MNKYVPYNWLVESYESFSSTLTRNKEDALFFWTKEEASDYVKRLNEGAVAYRMPWVVMAIAVPRSTFKALQDGEGF